MILKHCICPIAFIVLALVAMLAFASVCQAQEQDEYANFAKFGKLISKFGLKAIHFLTCMGPKWAEHCVEPTLGCLAAHDIPGCIELLKCEGKDAKACGKHLH